MMTKTKDSGKSRKGGNITGAEWIRNNKYIYENGKIELGLIQLRDVQNPTDMLRQQLISEGKEDYYIISFTSLGGTFTMQMLPIYGNANGYVTRWFSPSAQEAIELFKRESDGNIAKILKGPVDENGNIISRKGSRKGQDFTAQGINNVANAFKDITTKKIPNAIGKLKEERDGSRKGTGPLCDLGSVSGKGSRPENLGSIASKVAIGRKRSINMDGEYGEQESREGSRRGDALAQQIIGDNVEEDSDGYNFYDARNALRLEGYSEDEIEDNIDTWMYQHMN
jgi:hypothetical protein